jgi:NAD-dependent SIR2 family protein deacetylase
MEQTDIVLDALVWKAHGQLLPLIEVLQKKRRIVVIAGAGISAEAGSR